MTDELTPERVRAALPFLNDVLESKARNEQVEFGTGMDRLDSLDVHIETLVRLARAWLANAAAIAAARAEGVALGAANMREAACGDIDAVVREGNLFNGTGLLLRQRIAALAFPTDADAILRAERQKGAEAMRAAVRKQIGATQDKSWDGCEARGIPCPETGMAECSLDVRGQDCLCQHRYESFDPLMAAIDALEILP